MKKGDKNCVDDVNLTYDNQKFQIFVEKRIKVKNGLIVENVDDLS